MCVRSKNSRWDNAVNEQHSVWNNAELFPSRRKSSATQIRLAHLSDVVCKFCRFLEPSNCGLVILTCVRCDLCSVVPITRSAQNHQAARAPSRVLRHGVLNLVGHSRRRAASCALFSLLSSIPCSTNFLITDAITVRAVPGVVETVMSSTCAHCPSLPTPMLSWFVISSPNSPSAMRRASAQATGATQAP